MFSIFKWILIINLVIFGSWPFVRGYLPDSFQQGVFGVTANYVTEPVETLSGYRSSVIKENKYDGRIVELNGKVFANLMDKIKTRRMKAVLFFYNPNNLIHRTSLSSLNDIAANFIKMPSVSIIPVAIAPERADLNHFIDYMPALHMPLTFVRTANLPSVQNSISNLKLDVSSEPVIAFIDKNGMLRKQEFSYFMSNKINNFLNND